LLRDEHVPDIGLVDPRAIVGESIVEHVDVVDGLAGRGVIVLLVFFCRLIIHRLRDGPRCHHPWQEYQC
jgi:hypothetical protein